MQSFNNQKLDKLKKYKNYLYDFLYDCNLDWPCITCKWGPIIE